MLALLIFLKLSRQYGQIENEMDDFVMIRLYGRTKLTY